MRRPPGRPRLEKAPEPVASAVLEWIAKGRTLLSFCEQADAPDRQTILNWVEADPDFARHYKAAREQGQEAALERCEEIADIEPETPVQATWRKYQIETKLKILRMTNPARYGDKVAVDHGGGVTLNVITGVPHAD